MNPQAPPALSHETASTGLRPDADVPVSSATAAEDDRMADALRGAVPSLLETPRLLLRAFRLDDAEALHAALVESIDDLRRHLWFLPWVAETPSLPSAQRRCQAAADNFLRRVDLPYLAFDKGSGRLIGSVGLHRTDWRVPKTEVGYWTTSSEAGRGYATECVRALSGWALEGLGAARVELITDAQNLASRGVAERAGFRLEGVLHNVLRSPDGRLRHHCVYARLASAA